MIYTQKILKAIKFAAKTHNHYQQQKRKGKEIPYISHPMTVGIILALAKASENVVVAGILHDTIEDSILEKKVTPQMIEERFGEEVSELVVSVTEMDKDLPWKERKGLALSHVEHFSQGSVLVKSADILSNVTEIIDDYQRHGMKVFERFRATPKETLTHYGKTTKALIARWPESPLVGDLENLLEKIGEIEIN
jgi:(p)ppGpp synthase/HD superfamily hydrolase